MAHEAIGVGDGLEQGGVQFEAARAGLDDVVDVDEDRAGGAHGGGEPLDVLHQVLAYGVSRRAGGGKSAVLVKNVVLELHQQERRGLGIELAFGFRHGDGPTSCSGKGRENRRL